VSKKRDKRKERKKRGRANGAHELPRNVRETFERGAELVDELVQGVGFEEAIARRRRELRELIAPFDAVHVLGQLMFSEVPIDPDTYVESEHVGAAYVVEMVAAEFLGRPGRAGTSEVTPAIDAHLLRPMRRLCQEAALLESWRRSRSAGGLSTAESAARGRAASHHLMVRGPGWPWQEHETLRGLFGAERFAAKLKTALGFDVEDAIACAEAVARLAHERLDAHMNMARDSASEFGADHPAHRWAAATLQGWQAAGPQEVRALAITALWAMNHLGDAVLFDSDALANVAGIQPAAASAFLAALSVSPGQAEDDWFRLAETVRLRPLIEFGPDGFLPTVVGNELWALRGVLERALANDEAYQVHRGRWLERRAAELLARPLAPESVHLSVDYAYEDDDGGRVDGEIDGLLVCGDTAIVIEAKGATMRPGARRGGEAFIKHLRENVTKAAEQGTRARQALAKPGRISMDGKPIALPTVREVHPVVVTLDDLSAAAPVLWQFQGTRVMPEGVTIPWVVTLHELDLVAQTIEWPVQFVHFLRRRSRLNQIGRLVAFDELDWWMHYLLVGLYFEDDAIQAPTRLLSHTDPLDAWVLHERGMRSNPAPKPGMSVDRTSRAFLETVCDERPPGWVPAGCMLLDADGSARKKLWKAIDKVRPRARERGRPQRCTLGFGSAPDPMMICAVVVPNEDAEHLSDSLEELVTERVEEYGIQRVLGIGTTVGSRRPYEALGVLDRKWWEPPPDAPPGAETST
jgi:hypothetical protein